MRGGVIILQNMFLFKQPARPINLNLTLFILSFCSEFLCTPDGKVCPGSARGQRDLEMPSTGGPQTYHQMGGPQSGRDSAQWGPGVVFSEYISIWSLHVHSEQWSGGGEEYYNTGCHGWGLICLWPYWLYRVEGICLWSYWLYIWHWWGRICLWPQSLYMGIYMHVTVLVIQGRGA